MRLPEEAGPDNLTHVIQGTNHNLESVNVYPSLLIPIVVLTRDGKRQKVTAMVDTGADVCLVQRNLFDNQYLVPTKHQIVIKAANQQGLGGNHRELVGKLIISGVDQDTRTEREVLLPFRAFDADLMVDMILSYDWLATHSIDVRPRRHGIFVHRPGTAVWVPGSTEGFRAIQVAGSTRTPGRPKADQGGRDLEDEANEPYEILRFRCRLKFNCCGLLPLGRFLTAVLSAVGPYRRVWKPFWRRRRRRPRPPLARRRIPFSP